MKNSKKCMIYNENSLKIDWGKCARDYIWTTFVRDTWTFAENPPIPRPSTRDACPPIQDF